MTSSVLIGFKTECISLLISELSPTKIVASSARQSKKFRQIADSIEEAGIVEPIVVYPDKERRNRYIILDGHMRVEALKSQGKEEVPCLVAKDDEAFTYNKRINRLSCVQENHMIKRAIKNGVPEERIARALGINQTSLTRKKNLLDGICPEVVSRLKSAKISEHATQLLKRMKPVRQVEAVELMFATDNFTKSYVEALLIGTPKSQLADAVEKKKIKGLSDQDYSKMEKEIAELSRDIKAVESNYGTNMLKLVVANGYVSRLLDNSRISKYINRNQPEIFERLHSLQESIDADTGVVAK